MFHEPDFFRDMQNSNGEFAHGNRIEKLKKNLWGGKSADHDYIMALLIYVQGLGYKDKGSDPCMFLKLGKKGLTIVAVSVDDFLVNATGEGDIDNFYKPLTDMYQVKRIGNPPNFLC